MTDGPRVGSGAWRHWLREVAVIAAGALAALATQAWWQDRQDREREAGYVRQLIADTRENERRIVRTLASDSTAARSVASLGDFVDATGPTPPADSLTAWTLGALSADAFEPLTGTYAALLTTGDLRLIRDERLRGELVAYAAAVDGVTTGLRFYSQQAYGDVGRIVHAFPFARHVFTGEVARVRDDARRFSFGRLRRSPDVLAVLFAIQVAEANRRNRLQGLLRSTRQLRAHLEAQPGRAGRAPDTSGGAPASGIR